MKLLNIFEKVPNNWISNMINIKLLWIIPIIIIIIAIIISNDKFKQTTRNKIDTLLMLSIYWLIFMAILTSIHIYQRNNYYNNYTEKTYIYNKNNKHITINLKLKKSIKLRYIENKVSDKIIDEIYTDIQNKLNNMNLKDDYEITIKYEILKSIINVMKNDIESLRHEILETTFIYYLDENDLNNYINNYQQYMIIDIKEG